jgi:two-component system response regulator AtoC
VLLAEEGILLPEHLPAELGGAGAEGLDRKQADGLSLKIAQRETERRLITRALQATGGTRPQASRLLEISHPSLLSKIKAYNIPL